MRARSWSRSVLVAASRSSARVLAASARETSNFLRLLGDLREDRDAIRENLGEADHEGEHLLLALAVHNSPTESDASIGVWPGSTPKCPCAPGTWTSSTCS